MFFFLKQHICGGALLAAAPREVGKHIRFYLQHVSLDTLPRLRAVCVVPDHDPLQLQNTHCSRTTLLIIHVKQTAGVADSHMNMGFVLVRFQSELAGWTQCLCYWLICNHSGSGKNVDSCWL